MRHSFRTALLVRTVLSGFCSCVLTENQTSAASGTESKDAAVPFQQNDDSLKILIGGRVVAEYVFRDEKILRPFFRHLRTKSGVLVTRNQSPIAGQDPEDHTTMPPGLWLAFGELGGGDLWRNKGQVRHVRFVEELNANSDGGSFTIKNACEADGKLICTERCAF